MKYLFAFLLTLGLTNVSNADGFRFFAGNIYWCDSSGCRPSSLSEYTQRTGYDSYYIRKTYNCTNWYNPYTGQYYSTTCRPSYTYERRNYGWRSYDMPVHTWAR